MKSKQKLVVILGQTATGKSDLAVLLAKKFNGEIISADSRQVYKGLDIGTGKVTKAEMQGIPHHLLDVASPKRQFSVAEFKKKAEDAIENIAKKEKLPIMAGGTGFYIEAIIDGITPPEVPPNPKLRKKLDSKTAEKLFKQLEKLDPDRALYIDPHNKVRIIRAIEVAETLGSVPKIKKERKYDVLQIGIALSNEDIKKKIKDRLIKRLNEGMIKEAQTLHDNGLSWRRMEELGLEYRYIARHLQGKISKEDMIEKLNTAIWQYAKRQKTWFKRDKRIHWFAASSEALAKEGSAEIKKIEKLVEEFCGR